MDVLVVNRLRAGACLRRCCGFLNTGAQWHMLPQSYPNYKTVHRRFQAWCRDETLRRILTDVANGLRDRGVLDEEECFIDATFVMAKGGGAEIGPTKRGKGLKIMAIVDRHGLPLSVSTHAANHHEVRSVQLCFDFYMIGSEASSNIRQYRRSASTTATPSWMSAIATRRAVRDARGSTVPTRARPPTQDRRRAKPQYATLARRALLRLDVQSAACILVRWEFHARNVPSARRCPNHFAMHIWSSSFRRF